MCEDSKEMLQNYKGVALDIMQNLCYRESLPIVSKPNHTVMYELPLDTNLPKPRRGRLHWDRDHVKMPFSSQSLYATMEEDIASLKPRWDLIKKTLSRKIKSASELQEAILVYNPKYKSKWNFTALHILFNEVLEEEETNIFFDRTLPAIIHLALQLPALITTGLPHLRQNRNHSVSLSQLQISSLLANAFLCTFPHRNTQKKQSEYNMFPDINFNRLYQSGSTTDVHVIEKLKCICHYFRRVCAVAPRNVITFTRCHISTHGLPNWSECTQKLGDMKVHVTSQGTIEDHGINMLQVDFANKFIGGGVLGWGCVQEEIRFVICPELIVSRLFTEALKPNEAIVITGCERYSLYKGYSQTFTWAGDYKDETPCDSSQRRRTTIVAIDALQFTDSKQQFLPRFIERELNKAYVGFRSPVGISNFLIQPVATGNWGCGAFGADPTLKAIIQMMAARSVGRDYVYFTFGDLVLCEKLYSLWCFLRDNNVTIGQLWNFLCAFNKANVPADTLYSFLVKIHAKGKINCTVGSATEVRAKLENNPFKTIKSELRNVSKVSPSKHSLRNNTLTEMEIEQCFKYDIDERINASLIDKPALSSKENTCHESLLDRLSALEGKKQMVAISETDSDNSDENFDKISAHNEIFNNDKPSCKTIDATQGVQRKISDFFTSLHKSKQVNSQK